MADDKDGSDLETVFAAFRSGVQERVREDDVTTHFDLAVAYAEMGLYPDAAAELELVLRHDPRNARARAELAVVHRAMGDPPKPGPIGSA